MFENDSSVTKNVPVVTVKRMKSKSDHELAIKTTLHNEDHCAEVLISCCTDLYHALITRLSNHFVIVH